MGGFFKSPGSIADNPKAPGQTPVTGILVFTYRVESHGSVSTAMTEQGERDLEGRRAKELVLNSN